MVNPEWLESISFDTCDRLNALLQHKGISPQDLADLSGMPLSKIKKYLYGNKKLDLEILAIASLYLDVNVNWLLTGAGKLYNDREEYLKQFD